MKNWKSYLPSPQMMTQETLATLVGIILSAWIISKVPALHNLVKDNNQ